MRLKYVSISEYKNLKDFELNFNGDNFVEIFIGKNGSGKSNFLEALVEIFHHAISLGESDQPELYFDYKVAYQIASQDITLEWTGQKFLINGKPRKSIGKTPIPQYFLIYYSGKNSNVSGIVSKYEVRFSKNIKDGDVSNVRRLISIGGKYRSLLLSVLLLQDDACIAKNHLIKALGISNIGLQKSTQTTDGNGVHDYTDPILKISLTRPNYAVGNSKFDINNQDEDERFWKASGKTRIFLDHLYSCIHEPHGLTVANGYQSDDSYLLHIDIGKLREKLPNHTSLDFCNAFDMLIALGMLEEITVPIALEGNRIASINDFSDGQFQSVYIYAITELFKEVECLTLLDEPDAFLHPEWQSGFLSQVEDISKEAAKTNHILLTSHSASTVAQTKSDIFYLSNLGGSGISAQHVNKSEVIKSLSSGLITFTEGEAHLNINHVIQSTDGPILWVEGISDELILQTAWDKLHPNKEQPFIIQNAFCKSVLYSLFSRKDLGRDYPDRVMVALFDFDDAYNDWNGLQPTGPRTNYIEDNPLKGLTKQLKHGTHYASLLPVPDNSDIKPQVLDPNGKPWSKNTSPNLPIELLFYSEERMATHYEKIAAPGGGNVIKFRGNKTNFAKNTVPTFDNASFELFRPMFELIETRCL